jgi:hypothetical protein
MHNQPKAIPLRESVFFRDGSSARPLVEGTVARGTLQDDAAFFTGKNGAVVLDALPFPLTAEVLDRGEQRFNIYCAPCHDTAGTGQGMIVHRGYRQPPWPWRSVRSSSRARCITWTSTWRSRRDADSVARCRSLFSRAVSGT